MKKIFGESWKTTIGGIITAIGYLLSKSSDATLIVIGDSLVTIGFVLVGKQAADSRQVKDVKRDVQEIKMDNELNSQ